MVGKITFYNVKRGYGFVTAGNEQYFFHHTNFKGIDEEANILGADVHFTLAPPLALGKRDQATKLRFASAEDVQRSIQKFAGAVSGLKVGA